MPRACGQANPAGTIERLSGDNERFAGGGIDEHSVDHPGDRAGVVPARLLRLPPLAASSAIDLVETAAAPLAGRPFLGHAGSMSGEEAAAILEHADAMAVLPTLGGMARPDGVMIVSDRFWASATTTGRLREGEMPSPGPRLRRVPLLRGLLKLASALSPLFRPGNGAPRRERWLLAAAVCATFALVLLPDRVALVGEAALTATLLGWMLRGRTLFLHGAEHRAITAAEQRQLRDTWNGRVKPSRFARRCGTNFAVLVLPVAFLLDHFVPRSAASYAPVVVSALALALTMELWQLIQNGHRCLRVLLLPGLAVQRLTTREPELDETRVALIALASVLRRELAFSSDVASSSTAPHRSAA